MTLPTALTEALASAGVEDLAGRVAVVLAPPGIGKTALLVHAAVGAMRAGQSVLHVAVGDTVDHVRAQYEPVLSALGLSGAEVTEAERHRMVHSMHDPAFEVGPLRAHLELLSQYATFSPALVVVDGLTADVAVECVADLVTLASDLGVPLWMSLSIEGAIPEAIRSAGTVGIRLTPRDRGVSLSIMRQGVERPLDVVLTTDGALVGSDGLGDRVLEPGAVHLYSGGATGTEAAFGALAQQYGLVEHNISFAGHIQDRTQGRTELSERELAAGDVSMVYVSRRLSRTYSTEGTLIRKILQVLWHMVSRSQKVIVVGAIQEDGTVVGGTGWSVELARMWNKDLWVYDQARRGWFRWTGHAWEPGETVLDATHICGTGTRKLTDHGREALEDLFARSFG